MCTARRQAPRMLAHQGPGCREHEGPGCREHGLRVYHQDQAQARRPARGLAGPAAMLINLPNALFLSLFGRPFLSAAWRPPRWHGSDLRRSHRCILARRCGRVFWPGVLAGRFWPGSSGLGRRGRPRHQQGSQGAPGRQRLLLFRMPPDACLPQLRSGGGKLPSPSHQNQRDQWLRRQREPWARIKRGGDRRHDPC
jgi:hypothetical protein